MSQSIQSVVLGGSGYVGGELLRLILAHPNFELAAAASTSRSGQPISETFGHLSQALSGIRFCSPDDCLKTIDDRDEVALFCAAPHAASAQLIASVIQSGRSKGLRFRIVDSSADFRFAEQAAWESVYETTHGAPDLLSQFSCAVPEHAKTIDTPHVGHPGCFATAVVLGAVPLIQSGLTAADLFVTGVTGSTGSGRTPQAGTHHPDRNSNLYAYKPLKHRHAPEMAKLIETASGRKTGVHFVPHSGPFARGIHATVQAKAKSSVSEEQLYQVFEDAYGSAPFVELVRSPPRLKNVVASNMCHINVATDGNTVVVMSAIDNLVKGAAGGAVQWMNRLFDLPETSGLTATAAGWT